MAVGADQRICPRSKQVSGGYADPPLQDTNSVIGLNACQAYIYTPTLLNSYTPELDER